MFNNIGGLAGEDSSDNERREVIYKIEPAKIKDHPYIGFVQFSENPICIGTIVTKKFILTLSSCVRNYEELEELKIRVGSSTLVNGTIYSIQAIHHHPEFQVNSKEENYANDIALVELANPIDEKIGKSVELFEEGEKADAESEAVMIGLSKKKLELHRFTIALISTEECEEIYKNLRTLSSDQICAGKNSSFEEMCLMDKGAPLVIKNRQLGIFDEMKECERWFDKPMIYTSVASHRSWINKIVPDLEKKGYDETEEESSILLYIIIGALIIILLVFGYLVYKKWYKNANNTLN